VLPREYDSKVCKKLHGRSRYHRSRQYHFAGRKLDLDPQGLSNGPASLFVRPYEVTIVRDAGSEALSGVVQRVHGFGPARRLEIALREGEREHYIEVTAPRHEQIAIGQHVGLKPRAYRLFASNAG
jgi:sulfate transport system ATP-binding protein